VARALLRWRRCLVCVAFSCFVVNQWRGWRRCLADVTLYRLPATTHTTSHYYCSLLLPLPATTHTTSHYYCSLLVEVYSLPTYKSCKLAWFSFFLFSFRLFFALGAERLIRSLLVEVCSLPTTTTRVTFTPSVFTSNKQLTHYLLPNRLSPSAAGMEAHGGDQEEFAAGRGHGRQG